MKNSILFIVFVLFMVACGGETKQNQSNEAKANTPEAKVEVRSDTSHAHVFSCPMHPEVTGKEGDKCPKCSMALEHKD
ncbi:MAG: hypothetical protein RL757_2107 [Bacteroidota bacterium]|jgi:hypothetical protein